MKALNTSTEDIDTVQTEGTDEEEDDREAGVTNEDLIKGVISQVVRVLWLHRYGDDGAMKATTKVITKLRRDLFNNAIEAAQEVRFCRSPPRPVSPPSQPKLLHSDRWPVTVNPI